MIVDANVLLYAVDETSPHHAAAAGWLTEALNGNRRIGLPAQSLIAFVRIVTHPRVSANPARPEQAWAWVAAWLAAPAAWVPDVGKSTLRIFGELVQRHGVSGNLTPDAMLAASGIEHGVPVVSADGDFARFPEISWVNPLRG